MPTAVELKLLLSEYNECGVSGEYGVHHPSVTTFPCRTSMKLCSESNPLSATSINSNTPADETPSASGLLRGKSPAAPTEHATTVNATATRQLKRFMCHIRVLEK